MAFNDMEQDLEFILPIISGKVSTAINRIISRNLRMEGLDITPEQWTVLAFLWNEDGVTQQKLCDATYKDKSSMTRLIDNLTKLDLVYRQGSVKDRRLNYIYLTSKGLSIKEKATEAIRDTMNTALFGIDENKAENIRQFMKLIFNNIKDSLEEK